MSRASAGLKCSITPRSLVTMWPEALQSAQAPPVFFSHRQRSTNGCAHASAQQQFLPSFARCALRETLDGLQILRYGGSAYLYTTIGRPTSCHSAALSWAMHSGSLAIRSSLSFAISVPM